MSSKKNSFLCLFLLSSILHTPLQSAAGNQSSQVTSSYQDDEEEKKYIRQIIVQGLTLLPEDTIISKVPFESGDLFDQFLTNPAIRNIYDLGYFKQVYFNVVEVDEKTIDLYVIVEEKTPIKDIEFKGNKNLEAKDLKKKLGDIIAAEERELKKYAHALERYYAEKNYHFAKINAELVMEDNKGIAVFTVNEGPMALVKKVRFDGNKHFGSKKLRSLLFTQEDWILGVIDRAGTYNPLAIEQDRDTIEKFYQSNGYLNAKVPAADVLFDDKNESITITFNIQEGDIYTISSVNAPASEPLTEENLLEVVPVKSGQLYSRELIRISIEQLRMLWGAKGYIYADIDPSIEPDEENKTVAVNFYSHPGNTVHVNKINIFGNEKARDKVIRRQLTIEEGDLLTTPHMEVSKNRVAQLGYFDLKEGINWKINRLSDDTADLDLLVKEVKTGRFEWKTSYGGSPTRLDSSNTGLMAEISMNDRNLWGKGLFASLTGRISSEEKALNFSFANPWFLDKPVRVGFDGIFNHTSYDEIKQVKQTVGEKQIGASVNAGFVVKQLNETMFLFDVGFQQINYLGNPPKASVSSDPLDQAEYQLILDERFLGGYFVQFQNSIRQNFLNHHVHISEGYKWDLSSKFAIPCLDTPIGFFKVEGDAHWYTSVIGDYQLVFHAHMHWGVIAQFGNHQVPYRELFNIGGPASVRAWRFGQISPTWVTSGIAITDDWNGEPIGGKKALFINFELVFPITQNLNIKGCVFYDGGSGWDTPDSRTIRPDHLRNNSFDFRQCIGVGLRLLEPQPIRVDWGFKLDRRKGEPLSEVQFSGYYDF